MFADRILSGMRPTGSLHLGHYHGVLKNWVKLQHEYECFFFVADWHALTTHYDTPEVIEQSVWDMVIDWLAAGVDPAQATLFIQSRVPEHAELHLLMSMITPLGWLERVPTYKDQQEKLSEKDLSTYGFLGYPLLQSADILIYRATMVPVGEDQVPHIEFTREIARRFNHIYGREPGFEEKAHAAIKKLGGKKSRLYEELRSRFQEQGDEAALESAQAMLNETQNLSLGDRERLFGYLEGGGKMILTEPEALLTAASRMPGWMGRRCPNPTTTPYPCAKTPTASARKYAPCPPIPRACAAPIRVTRPSVRYGNCTKSIPMKLHATGATRLQERRYWLHRMQTTGNRRCTERAGAMRERAQVYLDDPTLVRNIIADGCEKARRLASDTMRDVREAMGLSYS